MRPLSALIVDRDDLAILGLNQIHPRDQAEAFGGQRQGAGLEALAFVKRVWFGQVARRLVDAAVAKAALDGIGALLPFALDPFEIGQPRAVLVLVDNPRRQWRQVRR